MCLACGGKGVRGTVPAIPKLLIISMHKNHKPISAA